MPTPPDPPQIQPYATYISGRSPKTKLHRGIGPVKLAVRQALYNRWTDQLIVIWWWSGTEWKEIMTIDPYCVYDEILWP